MAAADPCTVLAKRLDLRASKSGTGVAPFGATMLIGRCAWHLLYYGHPRWDGVASWRGFNLRFTDGICPRCLERFRAEHQVALARRGAPVITPVLTAEEVA